MQDERRRGEVVNKKVKALNVGRCSVCVKCFALVRLIMDVMSYLFWLHSSNRQTTQLTLGCTASLLSMTPILGRMAPLLSNGYGPDAAYRDNYWLAPASATYLHKSDGAQVIHVNESTKEHMSLYCRLQEQLTRVLYYGYNSRTPTLNVTFISSLPFHSTCHEQMQQ